MSRSTLKRKLSGFANAYRDGAGVWKVPISDLLAAGLNLRRPTLTEGDDPAVNGADQGHISESDMRIRELTAELAAERERRLVAETTVRLLTNHLEDVRYALRALSGPETVQPAPPVVGPRRAAPEPAQAVPEPPRRGLWARIRGG